MAWIKGELPDPYVEVTGQSKERWLLDAAMEALYGFAGQPSQILRYRGAKPREAAKVVKEIPEISGVFRDLFGGSGAATEAFLKSGKASRAVIAEKNPYLQRLYKQLKASPDEVADELKKLTNKLESRKVTLTDAGFLAEVFDDLKKGKFKGSKEAAAEIFVGNYTRMYVPREHPLIGPYGNYALPERLAERVKRFGKLLGNVDIVDDWKKAVRGSKQGDFLFIDPPYYGGMKKYPGGGFRGPQQESLAEFIRKAIKGKISGVAYQSPEGAATYLPELNWLPNRRGEMRVRF